MIGSELLLGQIIDTNAAYLAQQLAGIGVNLYYKTTVGDNRARMTEAFGAALGRSDIIITSGGLGPTEDDLTREVVADVMGQPLEFRQELFEQIEALFRRHGFTMSPNNRKQAFIPQDALPIENPVGTAPGFIAEKDGSVVIALPGVPRELKFLMENFVVPYLHKKFSLGELTIRSRVLKMCGMGESRVDSRVGDLLRSSSNPSLGILAEPAQILLRITAKAETVREADAKIFHMEDEIRRRLGQLIFGVDDDTLEGVVNARLMADGKTLALLETHTGGSIAQRFVALDSPALTESLVANREDVLRAFIKMDDADWSDAKRDPWSLSVTLAHALRSRTGCDIATVSLGIAPGSQELAEADAASGKTCIAIDSSDRDAYWEFRFAGKDRTNQTRATVLTIEMLRRFLTGVVDPEHPHRAQSRTA
jgi:nicotinamide-nucleotide amidase